MNVLRSTVRLQFNKDFTFDDATACVDYYAKLGISHYYASPIYTARAGSAHGYDVVDFGAVNPELGGEDGLRRMVARLRQFGMGLVVDIVPNHMAVGEADNPWWLDVLESGPASRYAKFFDIDWSPPDEALHGKLLAPFLGKPFEAALADGDLKLGFDETRGSFHVDYGPHRFPISPFDYAGITKPHSIAEALARYDHSTEGTERLRQLLLGQHYVLVDWHEAGARINWRRFFDVTSLAAIRADRDEVFEATHALPLRLYQEGLVDGFRVDHIDGLADPAAYLARLRQRLDLLHAERPQQFALETPWLVVEKILGHGEVLRDDWQTDGATGYKFMDAVSGLLHDPAGEAPLTELWESFTGEHDDASHYAYRARKELAESSFAGDVDALTALLMDYAAIATPEWRIDPINMRVALIEFLAHFPTYRSYVGEDDADMHDRKVILVTLQAIEAQGIHDDGRALTVLVRWLDAAQDQLPAEADEATQRAHRALQRMQKLLPALDAKSVEDTVFYRYGRLLSRNEVGSWPGQFAMTPKEFHALNLDRALRVPRSMVATATHDHKRGEDTRMRLAVLSELPRQWAATVQRLHEASNGLRTDSDTPTPADELMLYQTLVGSWPLDLDLDDRQTITAFGERVAGWQLKALREAKLLTSWAHPDEAFEHNNRAFLDALLSNPAIVQILAEFVARIAPYAALDGLSQTLLRLTVPGVPDLYQGTEFWDLSLVDPDNRRPVDYLARRQALDAAAPPVALIDRWQDGHVKQALIAAALALRKALPEVFETGSYERLAIIGPQANSAFAFARRAGTDVVIAIVTRLGARADKAISLPKVAIGHWQDSAVLLPADAPTALYDALGGAAVAADGGRITLSDALQYLPVALLRYRI
ncbi:malto-oligosyltrehalose synthase [Nevskia ramosa]|uniref:malto-oligosyltrehalose synthase n=1 Tax=Nevskia ramosa TaxID=64002 RepID=UPI0023572950|nr:malto-oligosyltrehalose synthase [Nevskia ramosa]